MPGADELERLLSTSWSDPHAPTASDAAERLLPDVVRDAVTAMTAARVEYVLVGALAYGLYAPARYTQDVDLLVFETTRDSVQQALQAAGFHQTQDIPYRLDFRDPETNIEVNVLLGAADPEKSALADPDTVTVFGTAIRVIKPEYLLWMSCLSDLPKDFAVAVELVKAGHVNVPQLQRFLLPTANRTARAQLQRALAAAEAARGSSYSRSVAIRRWRAHANSFVGIFWAVQAQGSAPILLEHRCSPNEAEPYGCMLGCAHAHYEVWERWRKNIGTRPAGVTSPIAMSEYEEWPRGLIVYDTESERFVLYADTQILRRPVLMAAIHDRFGLPADRTDAKPDNHYRGTRRLGR
jgi:hypothetical protein